MDLYLSFEDYVVMLLMLLSWPSDVDTAASLYDDVISSIPDTGAALLDNNETTAKSTTQDGGMAGTSVNAFV